MSIHVQISEEAQQSLRKQQRNSTLLSIFVSILVLVLIGGILGLFLLPNILTVTPTIITYEASIEDDVATEFTKPEQKVKSKPAAASQNTAKVLAVASNNSQASIPVPVVDVQTPSADFGDGEINFGTSFGEPDKTGADGFKGIPQTMQKRCSKADRMARLQAEGGVPECEVTVVKALDWLKKTQNTNGSWEQNHSAAMTGLALLAYLGHCETPQSADYGPNVVKAITYLVDVGMKKEGMLTDKEPTNISWVYDHGIATYALAEAYTFCKQLNINIPNLDIVTKKAGDLIIEGQADTGSWLYKYKKGNDGDNSVGFWQIQALKACKHTKLWKDQDFVKPIRKAHEWLDKVQGKDGTIGYRGDSTKSPGLTGGGVLAFQMWEKGKSKNVRNGIQWIANNSEFELNDPDHNKGSLYYHYYHAQAMINYGGKEWNDYNLGFRDKLIKAQNPDGSWPHGGGHYGTVSLTMATTMATLMLEVYYRFLPGTGTR
jgi:hypothetical protein